MLPGCTSLRQPHVAWGVHTDGYRATASLRSLPAEKRTCCLEGTRILARVCGFTPVWAARVRTPKDPKPVTAPRRPA